MRRGALLALLLASSAIAGIRSVPSINVSSSGTCIGSAPCAVTTVVDSNLGFWTISAGVVYLAPGGANNATAGFSAGVVTLLYYSGTVYQFNGSQWYPWEGTAWGAGQGDPRPGGSLGIKIVGTTFTDLNNNIVQLQGTNVSGLEAISGFGQLTRLDGFNNTTTAQWTAMKNAWQMNIIRLPLNEYNWNKNLTSTAGVPYQSIIQNTVARIVAAGMYVILDLHISAPNSYTANGGAGSPVGQGGYADSDNSPPFWTSVANTFKNNPAVLFELFNEPLGVDQGAPWSSAALQLLQNNTSGTVTFWAQNNNTGVTASTGVTFTPAGHQQLLNAIRATGATNIILWSCPNWDNYAAQSLNVVPTDTLSPSQIAATIHYEGGNVTNWKAILSAGYPILETEFWQPNLSGQPDGGLSGYPWLVANHIGYVMWGPNNWNSGSDLSPLITYAPWNSHWGSNGQVAWPLPPPAFYVSPSGSDSNAGTLSAPFLTLAHAKAQMEAQGTSVTYVRAGTYASTALTLGTADNGQTWTYYPPDGYDSAILDGGASSPSTGGNPITIDGVSTITFNGLTIQHCKNWCVGIHGGPADPDALFTNATASTTNVTLTNDIIANSYNVGSWTGGCIWFSTNVANLTIENNAIHDCQGFGIAGYTHYTYNSGDSPNDHTLGNFNNLLIANNAVYLVCQQTADCGAIYYQDQTTQYGTGSSPVTIQNNFIRDYQGNNPTSPTNLCRAVAIYLDSGASNANITGNVIANTSNQPTPGGACGSTTAYWVNNGRNDIFSGNLVDLGTHAYIADGAFAPTGSPNPTFAMTGNTVTGNILVGNWSGSQLAQVLGGGPNAGWFYSPTPTTPVPNNNLYYNYGSGSLATTANISGHNDSSPITTTNPLVGSTTLYPITAGSPVYGSPLNFPPIVGGYGPPGYSVPGGAAPSP